MSFDLLKNVGQDFWDPGPKSLENIWDMHRYIILRLSEDVSLSEHDKIKICAGRVLSGKAYLTLIWLATCPTCVSSRIFVGLRTPRLRL